MPSLTWSYGVTTCEQRVKDGLLQRTLTSLAKASFHEPRLFVDGMVYGNSTVPEGYQVTYRYPVIRTHANWVLSAYELYLRDPLADRYAIFQDDMVTYLNLRQYLDQSPYPDKGYLNLYTFPHNVKPRNGWYESDQMGKGGVALVFDNDALRTLLSQRKLVERPKCPHRGHRSVDGGIVDSMKEAGYKEYVHNPSLVQHTGMISSMDNGEHPLADTFKGENYNALDLLGVSV